MYEVHTREVPSRSVLCLKRNVTGWGEAWTLGKEFMAVMKSRPLPRIEGPAGAVFCIYWSEVSEDSDGPLEWCRPIPEDQAEQLAAEHPELTLRTEPAHREAFVNLGAAMQVKPAQWQLVSESMRTWGDGQKNVRLSDLGLRLTYFSGSPPDEIRGPDCDFAAPLEAA